MHDHLMEAIPVVVGEHRPWPVKGGVTREIEGPYSSWILSQTIARTSEDVHLVLCGVPRVTVVMHSNVVVAITIVVYRCLPPLNETKVVSCNEDGIRGCVDPLLRTVADLDGGGAGGSSTAETEHIAVSISIVIPRRDPGEVPPVLYEVLGHRLAPIGLRGQSRRRPVEDLHLGLFGHVVPALVSQSIEYHEVVVAVVVDVSDVRGRRVDQHALDGSDVALELDHLIWLHRWTIGPPEPDKEFRWRPHLGIVVILGVRGIRIGGDLHEPVTIHITDAEGMTDIVYGYHRGVPEIPVPAAEYHVVLRASRSWISVILGVVGEDVVDPVPVHVHGVDGKGPEVVHAR